MSMNHSQAQGVSPTDAELEGRINTATLRLHTAGSVPARRAAWAELQSLIKQRSPEQISWMEEQRGLTA